MFFLFVLIDDILINCLYVLLKKNLIIKKINMMVLILVIVKMILFRLIWIKLFRLILGIIIVFF